MKVTRYWAVKLITVISYLLIPVCHTYPSSIGIKNNEQKGIKKSIKQETKSINFNNVNTSLHQNIKINLRRIDRSIDSEPETVDLHALTDDELNLKNEIFITNPSTETSDQNNCNLLLTDLKNNSCCIQIMNSYFESTVNNIRQWFNSFINGCHKVNEILSLETTNKSDIELIRDSCAELKGNYLKLFKSVINALNKLQIENHSITNNTCPIIAGLEKIRNNIITFSQRPDKITLINNPFGNILKNFPNLISSNKKILQPTSTASNNSNSITFDKNSGTIDLTKIISNIQNVPHKIRESIEELISNVGKILIPGRCQELKGLTNGNISDTVNNPSDSSIYKKLPFLNPFENVLKFPSVLRSSFNNSFVQPFYNLRNLLQEMRNIIDEQINNIRNTFTKNNCKELEAMTKNNFSDVGNNSPDSSIHEKLPSQKFANGLLKNFFNSSIIVQSVLNNPFVQVFDNLRNLPQKMRKSIDEVISNIRSILTLGRCQEFKAMMNSNVSDTVDNPSDSFIHQKLPFLNPFENVLKFPSFLGSSFNNPFVQPFYNLRNLLQEMRKIIDEQINNIRNAFTKNNCKELEAMTKSNFSDVSNNSPDSSIHEKLPSQKFGNGLMKNFFNSSIIVQSVLNNPFVQVFDNLRNLPQKMRKSIDEVISNIRNILTLGRCQEFKAMINNNISDTVYNSSDLSVREAVPLLKPIDGLFKKSLSNNPFLQVFDNLYNFPQGIRKSIDGLISNIRTTFMENDCKGLKATTESHITDAVNNSSDFSTHEKLLSQNPLNILFKNLLSSSTITKSPPNNLFIRALDNLRNLPREMRKSIDELFLNMRKIFMRNDDKEVKAKTNGDMSDAVHNPVSSRTHEKLPFQKSPNEILKNLFSSSTLEKSPFHNSFLQALDNLRNFPQKIRKSIDEVIDNFRNFLLPKGFKEFKTVANSKIGDAVYNPIDSSVNEKLPSSNPINKSPKNFFNPATFFKFSPDNLFSKALDNLRNLPREMKSLIDEQITNIRDIFIKSDCEERKTITNSDITEAVNNLPDSSIREKLPFQSPLNGLFNKLFNSSPISKSPSKNPFLQAFENLRNLPQKMQKSIDDQITNMRNIFMKNIIGKELKTVTDSDTNDSVNKPADFLNILFKDIYKISAPTKVLSHNSRQFEEIIEELITNIRSFFRSHDFTEPKARIGGLLSKPINSLFDPSIIYQIFSSPPFILNEFLTNIFKFSSSTKSSGHNYFLDAFDNLHNLRQDVRKSIGDLISNVKHVIMSNERKGRKTAVDYLIKKQSNHDRKSAINMNVLFQNPHYQLFNKMFKTSQPVKSSTHNSWIQLLNKPLPNSHRFSTRKNLPFSSLFHKKQLLPRRQSDYSKHYSLKKFW